MRKPRIWTLFHGVLLVFAALYFRLVWIKCLLGKESLRFFDTDPLYHLRVIRWGAETFPRLTLQDPYLYFPQGGICPWPGGFDWALAGILRFTQFFGLKGQVEEEIFLAFLLSVIGVLTVALAFHLARNAFSSTAGWWAAWMVALNPALIDMSRFGRIDHHVFEPIILLAGLSSRLPVLIRALALGGGLVLSQSAILPLMVVALVQFLSDLYRKGERERRFEPSFRLALATMLLGIPLVSLSAWAHGTWWDYRLVGSMQLSILLLWFLSTASLYAGRKIFRYSSILLLVPVLWVLWLPFWESLQFVGRNEVVSLASEARGSVRDIFRTDYLSLNIYVWPMALLGIAMALIGYKRKSGRLALSIDGDHSSYWISLLVSSVVFFLLLFFQLRFAAQAAALMCVSVAGVFAWVQLRVRKRWRTSLGISLALACWLGASHYSFGRDMVMPRCGWSDSKAALFDSLFWLRDETPDPGRGGDPRIAPRYGVMAPWNLGHHLTYLAQRPAVATPFIFDLATPGLKDSVHFFYIDSLRDAYRRAKNLNIRYVLVRDYSKQASSETQIYNSALAKSFAREYRGKVSYRAGSRFRQTVAGRLFSSPGHLQGDGFDFRLRFEVRSRRKGQRRLALVYELR